MRADPFLVSFFSMFTTMGRKVFLNFTRSLAPADFSGAVFTCAHFQKICSLCQFQILVKNDLSAVDLVHADFCQT